MGEKQYKRLRKELKKQGIYDNKSPEDLRQKVYYTAKGKDKDGKIILDQNGKAIDFPIRTIFNAKKSRYKGIVKQLFDFKQDKAETKTKPSPATAATRARQEAKQVAKKASKARKAAKAQPEVSDGQK